MRIVILGAGAIGQLYGAMLSQGDKNDVSLVERDQTAIDAIGAHGISCAFGDERLEAHPPVMRAEDVEGEPDLVLLCTKTPDTTEALEQARGYLGEGTYVLSLQNGLGNAELIKRFVDPGRVLIGMCTYNADRTGLCSVRSSGEGIIKFMPLTSEVSDLARAVEGAFNEAGLECEVHEDVWRDVWQKAAYNAALNSTSAVCRVPCGGMGILNKGMDLCNDIIDEACAVAEAYGVEVDATRLKNDLRRKIFGSEKDHITSMAQDVIMHRQTEVGSINGAFVRYAAAKGLSAPYNEAMFCLIKSIESTYDMQVDYIL